MQWFSQNWIWIALSVGGVFFMMRMSGWGIGHGSGRRQADELGNQTHGSGATSTFDPVSHHAIANIDGSVSTLYRARAYHFENREDRDLFESDPEKHLAEAARLGQAAGSDYERAGGHRRHGC